MTDIDWPERFREARKNRELAILEGFHPLKHALIFRADMLDVVTDDLDAVLALSRHFAPSVTDTVERSTTVMQTETYQQLFRDGRRTEVLAVARRRVVPVEAVLQKRRETPAVLLEAPTHHGNIGAAIRAAAGAGASAVVTTGLHDPWHAEALRGSAGLHYALPVAHATVLGEHRGSLVALDPEGDTLRRGSVPSGAILAFGSERRGLSEELLERADLRISIPMQPGVTSLNLASAVAVALYAWRLAQ